MDTLKIHIQRELDTKGQVLSELDDCEMGGLMAESEGELFKAYPDPNSYQILFWEQQLKYKNLKGESGKGMRWHPMIICWCLYMRNKSGKAYDAMRESGFVSLPSSRTLFDYSHYTKGRTGFQEDVVGQLIEECEKAGVYRKEELQYFGLLQYEGKIQEDLVYDKHTGDLVGFVDLDRVSNDLDNIENSIMNTGAQRTRYMLVIMVRGLSDSLKFPLAGFVTDGVRANNILYPMIWEALKIL